MSTIISTRYGEEPDALEQLFQVLASDPLDPTFEEYGNFCCGEPRAAVHLGKGEYADKGPIYPDAPGMQRFWGNFYELSHVFRIDTDEPELIERLTVAIRTNQATEAYTLARKGRGLVEKQPEPEQEELFA
jgi:hypothetical protein